MDEKIKEQILYIRASGLTNMFDITMVQRLANEYGFYELVIFLEGKQRRICPFYPLWRGIKYTVIY